MELDDQVVSKELARKLKELGVEQELVECSAYYDYKGRLFGWTDGEDKPYVDYAKAHTVAELGEMLPMNMDAAHCDGSHRHGDYWTLSYYAPAGLSLPDGRSVHDESAMTEADARAKMLIYLVENEMTILP